MVASQWATALRATIAAVIAVATEEEIEAATEALAVVEVEAVAVAAPAGAGAEAVSATDLKRTREAKASRVFLGSRGGPIQIDSEKSQSVSGNAFYARTGAAPFVRPNSP